MVGLGLSALDVPDAVKTVAVAVGAVALFTWFVGYFATFWSTTGQSPGARVMGIRVVCARERTEPPSIQVIVVRLAGFFSRRSPLCAGFLLILSTIAGGVAGVLARTVVRYASGGGGTG